MIELKCNACGGNMDVDVDRKEAICPYCGNHVLFEFEKGKKGELNIIPAKMPTVDNLIPKYTTTFYTESQDEIQVKYFWSKEEDAYTRYISKEHVLFYFRSNQKQHVQPFLNGIGMIKYPNDAMEERLHFYVPKVISEFALSGDAYLIVIKKINMTYPLELIGPFNDVRHTAWVISRLLNLCCLLEYSGIGFKNMTVSDLMVEPYHHQILLFGGWQDVQRTESYHDTGIAIRKIGMDLISDSCFYADAIPSEFHRFLNSEPCNTAADDFAAWDQCLLSCFGKRKFVQLHVALDEIYK